ncbi:phosphatidylglycerophosphatase A [Halorhodospira abdelmalekii]|uniref:phosphatidylglycerophosphatase A family protein n=1 Tax=Halorhodospira abdelmalekii TaxID=421629 RepID=UPI001907464B|nr:phosphatidylglycerophosphatase A [Halorhodospira abdelmalekii]MBK1734700.1 phosphatidylglycerophosphatase A [Halorhodospira abdelmalekii]
MSHSPATAASFRLRDPVHLLAVGFGSGLAPWAPGTFGTVAALPLFALLYLAPLPLYLLLSGVAVVAGVWICGRAAADVGVHDHPAIVWDEIAGFLIAALPLVLGFGSGQLLLDVAVIFVLFRLFDALKPWPICLLDRRLGGGLGIMADDIAAGVAAALLFLLLSGLWAV